MAVPYQKRLAVAPTREVVREVLYEDEVESLLLTPGVLGLQLELAGPDREGL
jgi:hypothetical protein